MIRQKIVKLIQEATGEKEERIKVERPEKENLGDYSTNIALHLKKPAAEIVKRIKSDLGDEAKASSSPFAIARVFEKVEVAGPGFINFFISREYLQEQVREILKQKEKFGSFKTGKGKKVNVEFISANPTGELHIGHGRGAFFGDALSKVLERAGYKVTREYFINDAPVSGQIRELGKTALGEGRTYLTPYIKEEILKLRKLSVFVEKMKIGKDEILFGQAGHLLANEIQKDIKGFIENRLNIKFDNWIQESKFYRSDRKDLITKTIQFLIKKGLIYKRDGAVWIKTSKYGDVQDWVIEKSNGEATYLLSDIAYHKDKIDRKFDKLIDIWGADHQGHVRKMKAVARILDYDPDKLEILISQVVRLKEGKMSKREGNVITLEWLIKEVGLDAARFFYLMKSLDTQMEFNVGLAKERNQKSPVYYVQYAHARICSILRKAKSVAPHPQQASAEIYRGVKLKMKPQLHRPMKLEHPSELNLVKLLIRLPEIVEDTAKDYQVQRLPQYAMDLATSFHRFYRDCRVISEDKGLTKSRLSLILAAKTVLENTLDLMGISAPEKM